MTTSTTTDDIRQTTPTPHNNQPRKKLTKSMWGGNNSKLDFVVEKSFLEAVENTGLEREQVICVDVCDSLPSIFGQAGSAVRRDAQEHWKNCKRRKIRSHIRCLRRFGVAPNARNLALLAADKTASDDEDASDEDGNKKPPSGPPRKYVDSYD